MKVIHFENTYTRFIELKPGSIAGIRDLSEDNLMDLGVKGQPLAVALEHVSTRAQLRSFAFNNVSARASIWL